MHITNLFVFINDIFFSQNRKGMLGVGGRVYYRINQNIGRNKINEKS